MALRVLQKLELFTQDTSLKSINKNSKLSIQDANHSKYSYN